MCTSAQPFAEAAHVRSPIASTLERVCAGCGMGAASAMPCPGVAGCDTRAPGVRAHSGDEATDVAADEARDDDGGSEDG
jgi:hypothetical protein